MILIGIGGNLPSAMGAPLETCKAALTALQSEGIRLEALSPWYASAPQPPSDQPEFVNGVARISSPLPPAQLLDALHRVEAAFGRVRGAPHHARTLDLDLLDYDGRQETGLVVLPHPRMTERAFVLAPLADVAPHWRHPVSGRTAAELLAEIKQDQGIRLISEGR
ncbi:MAG: 2-amino-4-hydroxy-6-hydroxymethyldihydropteridine diphosphokinase [Alphaproteobacteria bacterium]|nr:2-amino-4-hydroxy-6-hydroxymethyldihydropteridine diphosphokinase [Alphaproteobacteria bacterium]